MQRDVEFEVDSVDKSGGFIGALYLNKSENVAITLVKEGLATVHSFSADSLSWSAQLYEAEVNRVLVLFCFVLWISLIDLYRLKQGRQSGMLVFHEIAHFLSF